jgi:type IV pilus assembly protein PilE
MQQTRKYSTGFTLIELMIVIAVVAILVLVALPAYQDQVIKTKRTVAKSEMQDLLARQEQFFVNNRQYATDLTVLGFGNATSYMINSDGDEVAATASDRIYSISISGASATAFTLAAAPQLAQARDTRCGTLLITSAGAKSESGSGSVSDCW